MEQIKDVPNSWVFAYWLHQFFDQIIKHLNFPYSQWDHHVLKNISVYEFLHFILSLLWSL